MFCTKCGKSNDDGKKFCTGCGAPIGIRTATENQADTPSAAEPEKEAFTKVDASSDIHFRKLDDHELNQPVDRFGPMKTKLKDMTAQLSASLKKGIALIKAKSQHALGKANDAFQGFKNMDPQKMKRLKITALVIVAVIVVSGIGLGVYNGSEAKALNDAKKYEAKEYYLDAIETYKAILEKNPEQAYAIERLAFLYLDEMNNTTEAESYLRQLASFTEDPQILERLKDIFPVLTFTPDADTTYTELISVSFATEGSGANIFVRYENANTQTDFSAYQNPIQLADGVNKITAYAYSKYGYRSEQLNLTFKVDLADKFVTFESDYFASAVKEALGLGDHVDLRESHLAQIETLQLVGSQLLINKPFEEITEYASWSYLNDISHMTNLKALYLYGTTGTDNYDFIAHLPHLHTLIINQASLSSVEFLEQATALEHLDLSNNRISRLTGIHNLKSLETLNLNNNRIDDVFLVSSLTQLKTLHLQNNSIKDVSVLRQLTKLESLSFTGGLDYDYAFLSNMKQLKHLDIGRYQVTSNYFGSQGRDFTGIKDLTNLETLSLYGNGIQSLEGIESLKNLKTLNLQYNMITEEHLNHLSALTKLEALNLANNQIKDSIEPLSSVSGLKYLDLSYNSKFDDFAPLNQLESLETLIVKGSSIEEMNAISNLSALKHLDLSDNRIESLDLSGLTGLQFLNLSNNRIENLPKLPDGTKLQVLLLSNNRIEDISQFATTSIPSLVYVNFANCNLKDVSPLASLSQIKYINVENNRNMVNLSAFDIMKNVVIVPYNGTINDIPSDIINVIENPFQ